ncbi:hypothetical protein RE6C_00237 [Rhodopirellula europaea 6C]|uniref:Uncharacterized protein n=1 Tax=Rhodopirellula europaea 6C TaxID=1263867 RepID=M2BAG2_9BACT|nr:hypothetical protein RE6C_00237 [Rhodopirellula europaea 6C]
MKVAATARTGTAIHLVNRDIVFFSVENLFRRVMPPWHRFTKSRETHFEGE